LKSNILLMVVWVGVFNISFASAAEEDFYGWQSFTLAGDMRKVSPRLDKVRWNVMSQTRLGNNHKDLTEYLLFAQVGYQLSDSLSLWLGYTHDWLTPRNKQEYQYDKNGHHTFQNKSTYIRINIHLASHIHTLLFNLLIIFLVISTYLPFSS